MIMLLILKLVKVDVSIAEMIYCTNTVKVKLTLSLTN
jgi:hypothetical protein